jgi:hypothetical protein
MPATIEEIRKRVDAARRALLEPTPDFAQAIPALTRAIDDMQALQSVPAPTGEWERAVWKRDLSQLRQEIARVAALAEHGETFMRGWRQMLGTGTYSPTGALDPLEGVAAHHVSCEG